MSRNLEQIDLRTDKIVDENVRDSFQAAEEYLQAQALNQAQWKFFEINIPSAKTNFKYAHGFNFVPTDILVSSIQGDQRVVFNYDEFDLVNLDITTAGPAKLRFFGGRYEDSRGNIVTDSYDTVSALNISNDVDGGFATDVYLASQLVDGGDANG